MKSMASIQLRLKAVILYLVLAPLMVSAQKYFRSYDKHQGLCDNSVCCVTQDVNGFLWIGTFNGLSRFDGINFCSYFHHEGDSTSISNSVIRALLPTADRVWVATDNGIDYYSFADGQFHHAVTKTKDGKRQRIMGRFNNLVYVDRHIFTITPDGVIYKCKEGDDTFHAVKQHGISYNAITVCPNNRLAVVGPDGVRLLKADGETVIDYLPFHSVVTHLVNIYYSANKQSLFIGYGIGYQSRAVKIVGNKLVASNEKVPAGLMSTVDYGNNTVFGIDGGGVVFDNGSTSVNYNPYNSNICGDAVYSLFVDRQDNLWIGTYRNGLGLNSERFRWFNILNRANHQLSYDIVTAVVPTQDKLYLGLDGGGLEIYDRNTKSHTTFTTANSSLPGNNITSMVRDGNYLWMTIYTKGLVRYSIIDHSMTTYPVPNTRHDAANLWMVVDDGEGHLWLGGPDVFIFDKKTRTMEKVDCNLELHCMGFAFEKDVVWIASRYNGLIKMNRHTKKIIKHYTTKSNDIRLPGDNISFLYLDHDGCLWFCTEHGGFYKMDEKMRQLTSYGAKQGLTDSNVTSMSKDDKGNIVVGTFDGLFILQPHAENFIRLDVDENVAEFTYNSSRVFGSTTFFGTTKGLVYFDVLQIKLPKNIGKVFLQSLELMNNDKRTINLYMTANNTVRLNHDENYFTVKFSSPDFITSNSTQYLCRLVGFDTKWRETVEGKLQYTKIPPGKYQLQVKATSDGRSWTAMRTLDIIITPPWYLTWWAKTIAFILVIVALVQIVRIYRHNLYVKHQMEITEVEKQSESKLNEAKMDFYTSIVHELRTPVFLIMAQIEDILEEGKDPIKSPRAYILDILRNANRLNQLISRVVDFRKVGAENLQLSLKHADVIGFCKSLNDGYVDMLAQKDIAYSFKASDNKIMLDFDSFKLELIISNLVTNAFKYTKSGGHVSFSVVNKADRVEFAVTDTGIGIDEKYRDTIFESFFRSERGKRQSKGDGLGLSYVKNLVELHGGKIDVQTEMGKGSTFTFYLPKQERTEESMTPALISTDTAPQNPAAIYTILIVDDERETVELLERNLRKEFRIEKAYDGEEGLAKAREVLPDIIISDITMPNVDGQELIRNLRADKVLKDVKIMVFTANTAEDAMITALDNGADAYLTKPVSLKLLRMRIDKLMSPASKSMTEITAATDNAPQQRYSKEERQFVVKCRGIIDDNITNPEFNVEMLANKMAMSHSALYKKLKQITGMSLIEFTNDYKIYKAAQMLSHGENNIKLVAEQCGFNDIKKFRSAFKKKLNMTPKEYMERQ